MARVFFLLVTFFVLAAVPCSAGQGTIRETDSQIIIEYWGGEDDVKAAEAHKAELAAQAQKEEHERQQEEARRKLHEERRALAARRAATRGY